jgi:hypothetical protein
MNATPLKLLLGAVLTLGLGACGGGGDAMIGGGISGLAQGASFTLQNNSSDTLEVTANGPFQFSTSLAGGTAYDVTVLTQPSGQLCAVENGSGTVDSSGDDVGTVAVTCVSMANVGGTVAGLLPGTSVTLSNGSVLLPVAINGQFEFPGWLAAGAAYDVTVATQPVGLACTVLNGSGTITAGVPVAITVNCS